MWPLLRYPLRLEIWVSTQSYGRGSRLETLDAPFGTLFWHFLSVLVTGDPHTT